jgi:hypothetical protein
VRREIAGGVGAALAAQRARIEAAAAGVRKAIASNGYGA